ncbi:unnamed protein product [Cochlearia groenlandica]
MAQNNDIEIREVWSENLEQECALIKDSVEKFPYVAMDTEFPGVVWQLPRYANPYYSDDAYELIKKNVNLLKLIQLGLTLSDSQGNLPVYNNKQCLWQFNFREFDLELDPHNTTSIKLLQDSRIDFDKFKTHGVESNRFAELLQGSGVVRNGLVQWVMFHCGADLGYLVKILTGENLPERRSEFLELVKRFFPRVYDVKHIGESGRIGSGLHGGLVRIAEELGVPRVGEIHQAGSDSLLTMRVFMEIKKKFPDSIEQLSGFLFQLGQI